LSQIREIDSRLETLKGESEDLPLSDQEVQALRERISEGVSRIEESERRAVDALRSVVE
jgi:hypothetical protein